MLLLLPVSVRNPGQVPGELKDLFDLAWLEKAPDSLWVKPGKRSVYQSLFLDAARLEDERSESLDELNLEGGKSGVPGDEIIEGFCDRFRPGLKFFEPEYMFDELKEPGGFVVVDSPQQVFCDVWILG